MANQTHLPTGTKLQNGSYSVGRVLQQDDSGITYFGADARRMQPVIVREFFPMAATRQDVMVMPAKGASQKRFAWARARFEREGRALARLRHENIVPVVSTFAQNGTAYAVAEYSRGQTLRDLLNEQQGKMAESEALSYIRQVGKALEAAHHVGLRHGALSLDDIFLQPASGEDAARGARSALLSWFATGASNPGGAAPEDVADSGLRGEYTDVYALAALFFELLTGHAPPPVWERLSGAGVPDARCFSRRLSERSGRVLAAGLRLPMHERPQSVREWLDLLDGKAALPERAPMAQPPGAELGPTHGSHYTPEGRGEAEILRQLTILFARRGKE